MSDRKKWTKDKIDLLRDLWTRPDISISDIATELKTTYDAVKHAIRRYNLSHYRKPKREKADSSSMQKVLEELNDRDFEKLKKTAKISWNIPKGKGTKQNKEYTKYLVFGDAHIPFHNEPAIRSILKLMDDEKFDGLINGGDFLDLDVISHWNKNKRKTLEGKRLREDYITANAILDEFDKRLPKNAEKHFFYGNHEDWYNQLIEEVPALEGLFEPSEDLNLEKRGYRIYKDVNHIEKFGRLAIVHGLYTSQNYVKKHIDELKTNVLHFHLHSQRERYESSEAHELSMGGYCCGCLCDLTPAYMKGRPHKWTHGFAILYINKKTGDFFVDMKRIVKGKFIYNDKIYDGNK